MPLRLIVNADDFGLTDGINRAVEELHRAGALTSATLMATGPAFDEAVDVAARNPTLGVGCHLVFVDGTPVSPMETIPSLLGNDGRTFRSSHLDFVQALLRGAIREEELAIEADAQIRKLQTSGISVTHVDSHKHTHLFPAAAGPVLRAAAQARVRAFRYPFEPKWSRDAVRNWVPLRRRLEQSALDLLEPAFRKTIACGPAEAQTTSGTLGIAATGTLHAPTLGAMLARLAAQASDGTYELCCHPGYNDADLARQPTRLRASREIELRSLLTVVPQLSRSQDGVRLIHYGEMFSEGA